MSWWRDEDWRTVAGLLDDPASARLTLTAAACRASLSQPDLGREALAKACEDPDVVYAFDRAGDNDSYPSWAADAVDAYGTMARALIQSGLPDAIATERAAMVFGLTAPDQRYLELAKSTSVQQHVLRAAADQVLIEHVAEYAREPVGKAFDEDEVVRDDLGRFAEEHHSDERRSFRVVGGSKVAVSTQVKSRRVQSSLPEKVLVAQTDDEILRAAAQKAQKDKQKADRKQRHQRKNRQKAQSAQRAAAEQKRLAEQKKLKARKSSAKATDYKGSKSIRRKAQGRVKVPRDQPVYPNETTHQDKVESMAGGWTPPFGMTTMENLKAFHMGSSTTLPDDLDSAHPIKGPGFEHEKILVESFGADTPTIIEAGDLVTSYLDTINSIARYMGSTGYDDEAEDYTRHAAKIMQGKALQALNDQDVINAQGFTDSLVMIRGLRGGVDGQKRQARVFVNYGDLISEMDKMVYRNGQMRFGDTNTNGLRVMAYDETSPGVWSPDMQTIILQRPEYHRQLHIFTKAFDEDEVVRDERGRFAEENVGYQVMTVNGRRYKVREQMKTRGAQPELEISRESQEQVQPKTLEQMPAVDQARAAAERRRAERAQRMRRRAQVEQARKLARQKPRTAASAAPRTARSTGTAYQGASFTRRAVSGDVSNTSSTSSTSNTSVTTDVTNDIDEVTDTSTAVDNSADEKIQTEEKVKAETETKTARSFNSSNDAKRGKAVIVQYQPKVGLSNREKQQLRLKRRSRALSNAQVSAQSSASTSQQVQAREKKRHSMVEHIDGLALVREHDSPLIQALASRVGSMGGGKLIIGPGALRNLGGDDDEISGVGVRGIARTVFMTDESWDALEYLDDDDLPMKFELYGEGTEDDPLDLGAGTEVNEIEEDRARGSIALVVKSDPTPVRISMIRLDEGGARWTRRDSRN